MPKNRIPLTYTNENKLKAVEEQLASALTRSAYCRDAGVPRTSHLTWARKREKLKIACETRPKAGTVGGGGRKSASHPIEDALVTWVKDQRREELPVSREAIVRECIRLLPGFLSDKTEGARLAWCDRFMERYGLTIRRISHSGRKKKEELIKFREAFAIEVSTVLITHFLDRATGLPPPYVLYNMDQTSVYCHLGARTTVDFVGVKRVPYGRLLPPHFVFKGKLGGDVEEEVASFCEPDTATCAVQSNAWFDEVIMLDWIEQVWRHEMTGPTVLILDSLKVHKSDAVKEALSYMARTPCSTVNSMLKAFVDGGKKGEHWKYTDDPNDPDCMFDWVYYAEDKVTVIERVKGRTTISAKSKKRWCAMSVYQLGGYVGLQFEYCVCGPVSNANLGSDPSPTLISLGDDCAVPQNALINWNYDTRSNGPYNCTAKKEKSGRKWIMLNAYQSSGTKNQHWKYTTNPNDPACLVDWAYYDAKTGTRKIADIKGRITKMGDKHNTSWCPLRVYRPKGAAGFQYAFCTCP